MQITKKSYFYLFFFNLLLSGLICAERRVLIINNTSNTLTIKGPTKKSNKVAIPVTLKPGESIVKDIEAEGGAADSLTTTVMGANSAIQSYTRKYAKPLTSLSYNDESGIGKKSYSLWLADLFTKAPVKTPTSF